MCCKGAMRLCHCKEKNNCQSMTNVIDAAYNIYKERGNKVKEDDDKGSKWEEAKDKGGEWKNAAKEMFKGKEEKVEGKKAN